MNIIHLFQKLPGKGSWVLDIYRIRTRIEEIRKRALVLKQELLPLGEKELTKNEIMYAAAERNAEVAIQASLDIANHIVAACGLERPKQEAGEVFFVLAKEKVIDKNLAEKLKEATGFRNLLVHEYAKINRHKTYENIKNDLEDLTNFAKEIEEFLEKREKPQKGFVSVLLILVILAGAVVAGYLYLGKDLSQISLPTPKSSITPSPANTDETVNWGKYTNNTYGYEIKFPDTYAVPTQSEKQKSQLGEGQNMCIVLTGEQRCSVAVDYWPESLSEVLKRKTPTDKSQPQDYSNRYVKGKMYVYKIGESTTEALVILPKPNSDKGVVTLDYTNYPGEAETLKTIERIVSTFKFIDQSETTPAADVTFCEADNDCGVNTCGCKAQRKDSISKNICAQACIGEPKCVSNKCVLIK